MKYLDFEWILYIIGIMVCGIIFTFADLTTNPAFVNFVGSMFSLVVLFALIVKFDETKSKKENESVD